MLSQRVLVLTCVLLLLTLCPDVLTRRGGFGSAGGRWGGLGRAGVGGGWGGAGAQRGAGVGGGHRYKASHVRGGSPSSGSNAGKMAGAVAAGALGGMVIGHGLGSMSRPGYGGYNSYGHGYGHPRYSEVRHLKDRSRNETDMDYYAGSASRERAYSCVLLFATTVSFLIGYGIS